MGGTICTAGIDTVRELDSQGAFHRNPIMWELWTCITGGEINTIDYSSYHAVNDYTCDIDEAGDIERVRGYE